MERRDFINNMIVAGLGSAVLPLSSFGTKPAAKCDFIAMVNASPHVRHGALYIPTVLDKPAPIFGGWLCSIEYHIFYKQGIDTGKTQDDAHCYMAILGDEAHKESIQIWNNGGTYTLVTAGRTEVLDEKEAQINIGEKTFAFRLIHAHPLFSKSLKLNEGIGDGEIAIVVEGEIDVDGRKCDTNQVVAVQKTEKNVDISGGSAIVTMREVRGIKAVFREN
ncbi:MAG: hypothetical protein ACI84C_002273 [Flavobacteriales bacterium]|jgi:hypothetical protein